MTGVWFTIVFPYGRIKEEKPKNNVKTTINGCPRLIHYGFINTHNPTLVFKKYALLLVCGKKSEKEVVLVLRPKYSNLPVFTF